MRGSYLPEGEEVLGLPCVLNRTHPHEKKTGSPWLHENMHPTRFDCCPWYQRKHRSSWWWVAIAVLITWLMVLTTQCVWWSLSNTSYLSPSSSPVSFPINQWRPCIRRLSLFFFCLLFIPKSFLTLKARKLTTSYTYYFIHSSNKSQVIHKLFFVFYWMCWVHFSIIFH